MGWDSDLNILEVMEESLEGSTPASRVLRRCFNEEWEIIKDEKKKRDMTLKEIERGKKKNKGNKMGLKQDGFKPIKSKVQQPTQTLEQTLEERRARHGSGEDIAEMSMKLYETVVTPETVHKLSDMHKMCLQMIFHKVARMCCGDASYIDNAIDVAGYAKLLADYLESK
jgi:hypothetical protein